MTAPNHDLPKLDLNCIPSDAAELDLSKFPDFLILGPQRTGTTWLHSNLGQHPQVFLSEPKELYYFNCLKGESEDCYFSPLDGADITDLGDYLDHFKDSPHQWFRKTAKSFHRYGERYMPIRRGEASAHYALLPEDVIADITALQPDLRAIILIRDPVERAWSHAKKDLARNAGVPLEAVPQEDFYAFFNQSYQRRCADYKTMLETWRTALKPGHLYIGFQKRIATGPEQQLREIYKFLDIRSDEKYIHQTSLSKIVNSTVKASPPEHLQRYLEDLFAEERDWLTKTFGSKV
ncbi:MAG: sulfotransferase [Pseudomonadota bacterium]